jgi:hypothetical protein
MKLVNVDLVDGNRVAISYSDGSTFVYSADQLRRLEPIEKEDGEAGLGPTA